MACEVERTDAAYAKAPQWDLPTASLTHQFANIYFARQANLSKPLRAAAERKFGKVAKTPVKTLDAEPGSASSVFTGVFASSPHRRLAAASTGLRRFARRAK